MIERLGIVVLAMLALTGAAQPEDGFRPTPEEQKRYELMSRPEQWFLESLAGPREIIDGQRLDPKLQYYFEERLTREWALFTKITAPMGKVEDRTIDGRGGPIPIRIYTPTRGANEPLRLLVYFHGGGWLYRV